MTRKTLSRRTKGIVATIAGGGLLLGTAGTFAFWEAVADVEGAAVQTGSLGLTVDDLTWSWTNQDVNAGGVTWSALPANYLMVPGHTVEGVFTLSAELAGTSILADLVIDGVSVADLGIPGALVSWSADGGTTWSTANTYPVTLGTDLAATADYAIAVRIQLPFNGAQPADNSANSYGQAQPYQWTFADAQIRLTQVDPTST